MPPRLKAGNVQASFVVPQQLLDRADALAKLGMSGVHVPRSAILRTALEHGIALMEAMNAHLNTQDPDVQTFYRLGSKFTVVDLGATSDRSEAGVIPTQGSNNDQSNAGAGNMPDPSRPRGGLPPR